MISPVQVLAHARLPLPVQAWLLGSGRFSLLTLLGNPFLDSSLWERALLRALEGYHPLPVADAFFASSSPERLDCLARVFEAEGVSFAEAARVDDVFAVPLALHAARLPEGAALSLARLRMGPSSAEQLLARARLCGEAASLLLRPVPLASQAGFLSCARAGVLSRAAASEALSAIGRRGAANSERDRVVRDLSRALWRRPELLGAAVRAGGPPSYAAASQPLPVAEQLLLVDGLEFEVRTRRVKRGVAAFPAASLADAPWCSPLVWDRLLGLVQGGPRALRDRFPLGRPFPHSRTHGRALSALGPFASRRVLADGPFPHPALTSRVFAVMLLRPRWWHSPVFRSRVEHAQSWPASTSYAGGCARPVLAASARGRRLLERVEARGYGFLDDWDVAYVRFDDAHPSHRPGSGKARGGAASEAALCEVRALEAALPSSLPPWEVAFALLSDGLDVPAADLAAAATLLSS